MPGLLVKKNEAPAVDTNEEETVSPPVNNGTVDPEPEQEPEQEA